MFRELAFALAARDVKLRYKQTIFGIGWALIQPLAAMAVFAVVFGEVVDVPSDDLPYPVFVLAGLILWLYLANSVAAAAESLVEHRALVTTVYFPRLLAPLAAVLAPLVDLAVTLAVTGVVIAAFAVEPDLALATLPAWVLGAIFLSAGVGLWLASLNALYRDVRYALGFLLQLWFFASPIVFPSSLFEGAASYVFAINPVVGLVDGFRWSLLNAPAPGPETLVSLASAVGIFAGGIVYFRRTERILADMI
jgi:lipopolysaccharide transport system permease protein